MDSQSPVEPEGGASVSSGMLRRSVSFEDRTLPSLLQIQSSLGKRILLNGPERQITYEDAPVIAGQVAGVLNQAGLRPGERVVTLLSNCLELIELWFGATWAGASLVPVNTALRGPQIEHIVRTSKPKLIVVEGAFLPLLESVPGAVADAKAILVTGATPERYQASIGGVPVQLLTKGRAAVQPHEISSADPAAILFTSGTTGPSKGVICPHAQFYWWGVLTGEALGIGPNDVLFTTLPMFHTNALNAFWQAMLAGCTYSFERRFSARAFWDQAREKSATVTYMLGAIVQILLKQPPSPADRRHQIRVALSPATPPELVEQFETRFGVRLIEGYGSTETNFILSNTIDGCEPGTMGKVQQGFEVRIVDENDCQVQDGEAGEMLVRHDEPFSVGSGYFGDPEATTNAWRNLWFHTGDRVVRDSRGVYRFLDRVKDGIRRRGENISSWEVENALISHPTVANAAVIGVPSEMTEEDVMAFVQLQDGGPQDPAQLVRFLETRVAYFAIPRFWEFVSELPLTENGKVKKHLLRAQGVTSATWDRERAGMKLNRILRMD